MSSDLICVVIKPRLRLGHTILTHSHVLDRAPPPMCDLCGCPITVAHILLDCQKYHIERRRLRAVCLTARAPLNVSTLLGDDDVYVIDAMFDFVRRCGLFHRL